MAKRVRCIARLLRFISRSACTHKTRVTVCRQFNAEGGDTEYQVCLHCGRTVRVRERAFGGKEKSR